MDRSPHILGAASNLLGIALLIITGLNSRTHIGKTRNNYSVPVLA